MIDHHVLNGDEHQEDDRADHIIPPDYEAPKSANDLTRRGGAGISVEQNETRGGDVECQAEERQEQQSSGKRREVHRTYEIQGDHQHGNGDQQIGDDEQVQQEWRQGRDQRDHDRQDGERHGHLPQRGEWQRFHPSVGRRRPGGRRAGYCRGIRTNGSGDGRRRGEGIRGCHKPGLRSIRAASRSLA